MARWLDVADVVALHVSIMNEMGWSPAPLRDEGALESAVMRPQMASHYEDADLIRQAALLGVGISQAQAFLDGNKRTAFAAIKIFLEANGQPLRCNPLEVAKHLELIAEADNRVQAAGQFETWLRQAIGSG